MNWLLVSPPPSRGCFTQLRRFPNPAYLTSMAGPSWFCVDYCGFFFLFFLQASAWYFFCLPAGFDASFFSCWRPHNLLGFSFSSRKCSEPAWVPLPLLTFRRLSKLGPLLPSCSIAFTHFWRILLRPPMTHDYRPLQFQHALWETDFLTFLFPTSLQPHRLFPEALPGCLLLFSRGRFSIKTFRCPQSLHLSPDHMPSLPE